MTTLKEKLRRGDVTLGSWVTIAHPSIPEILATAGFDWIVIDLEHSVITIGEAGTLIRTIESLGMSPLVRLTTNDRGQIKRVMDAGAEGVLVPMVLGPADVRTAVESVKYPPAGRRSVGLSRAQGYGTTFKEYAETIDERSLVIPQIEHVDAVRCLPAILDVPGVDATIIGPYDLSGSMGKPGRYDDADVTDVLESYERTSRERGVPMGFHVVEPDPARIADKVRRGYRFIGVSVDFMYLGEACRATMAEVRRRVQGEPA